MSILLIDFEATAIDTKQARIIEIGAMLVDDKWDAIPQSSVSVLVRDGSYASLTPEITKITGITNELLVAEAIPPKEAFALLSNIINDGVTHACAFNTAYDETLFKTEVTRGGLTGVPQISWLMSIPWICALNDMEKNYEFKSRRLMHVALEYGVTVNPKILHRAIADVELMRQMLKASGTTPGEMLKFKQEPWVYVKATLEKPWVDGGKSTDFAKSRGYGWERARGDYSDRTFPKQWVKRIKQKSFEDELTLPFKVERITI